MTTWLRRASRLRHRHYGNALEAVGVAVVIVALAITHGTDANFVVSSAGQFLLFVPTLMRVRHLWGPPCAECVMELPLNPAEAAREGWSHRALRVFHVTAGSKPRLILLLVVLLTLLALSPGLLYASAGMDGAARRADFFLGLLLLIGVGMNWMNRTHNRLAPWCPYCDDDGDEDEDEEEPVPTDGRGQPAPA
ncbi:hypothetical protein [Streptomyces sp. NPDC047976]|uniref:hypothetical protein n=1 Tax=unclassified Streptomyces TaxID=2593676 RepID=UPI0034281F76